MTSDSAIRNRVSGPEYSLLPYLMAKSTPPPPLEIDQMKSRHHLSSDSDTGSETGRFLGITQRFAKHGKAATFRFVGSEFDANTAIPR